jgi:hypothetical protein
LEPDGCNGLLADDECAIEALPLEPFADLIDIDFVFLECVERHAEVNFFLVLPNCACSSRLFNDAARVVQREVTTGRPHCRTAWSLDGACVRLGLFGLLGRAVSRDQASKQGNDSNVRARRRWLQLSEACVRLGLVGLWSYGCWVSA